MKGVMFNVYDLQNIASIEDKGILPIEGTQEIPYSTKMDAYGYGGYDFISNTDTSFITLSTSDDIITITSSIDTENLLGIEYKGQFFTQMKSGVLSATPADVKKGLSFIGNNGTIETGTLEV